jgi:hypothetical protein
VLVNDLYRIVDERVGGADEHPDLLFDKAILLRKPLVTGKFDDALVKLKIGLGDRVELTRFAVLH